MDPKVNMSRVSLADELTSAPSGEQRLPNRALPRISDGMVPYRWWRPRLGELFLPGCSSSRPRGSEASRECRADSLAGERRRPTPFFWCWHLPRRAGLVHFTAISRAWRLSRFHASLIAQPEPASRQRTDSCACAELALGTAGAPPLRRGLPWSHPSRVEV